MFLKPRVPRLGLVDLQLLPVVAVRRDQRAAADQRAHLVEEPALFVLQHRDLARPAAFRGRRIEHDLRAPVRIRRREFDRLLPAQPERQLHLKRQAHMHVPHLGQLRRWQAAGPVLRLAFLH